MKMDHYFYKIGFIIRLHAKLEGPDPTGCRIWRGCKSKHHNGHYGVIKVKLPTGRIRLLKVHRALYMFENDIYDLTTQLDVSHLCHNSLCCTVSHLSLEPRAVNNGRKSCKSVKICSGHGQYQNCIF